MSTFKTRLAIGACGAAIAILSAGPALAGEVTGSGKKENQNQGKSWCSFSGLNDDPTPRWTARGPTAPAASRSRSGRRTSSASPIRTRGNPGTFCNPNRTPLPPQPNRDQVRLRLRRRAAAAARRGGARARRRRAPRRGRRARPGAPATSSAAERTAPRRSESAQRREQQLAGGREVAADDDPLRVEQVAQRGHGACRSSCRRRAIARRQPACAVERGGDRRRAA